MGPALLKARGALVALLSAAAVRAAAPGESAAQAARAMPACERCHSSLEFLALAARGISLGESLVVRRAALERDRHAALSCAACHTRADLFPHRPGEARKVTCLPCHVAQDTLWRSGVHGPAPGVGARAQCRDCHGGHRPPLAAFLHTAEGRAAMRSACEACHPGAVQTSSVGVHADSVACTDCHGVHDLRPVPDPATRNVDIALARSCSMCHVQEASTWWNDVHGSAAAAQAAGARAIMADTAATCISCHGEHGIRRHDDPLWRQGVADACSRCHAAYGATYRDSYHGQANRVGSRRAAGCVNCHTAHQVLPAGDTMSSVAAGRLSGTCRSCHQGAKPGFLGYQPHANPRDRAANPLLFWVWLGMNSILFGTMVVWGAHAAAWYWRNLQRRRKLTGGGRDVAEPMDSALRGGPPYVWRFNVIFRVIHGMIIVTFFLLVVTGLPLRFSCTGWAPALMKLLGGAESAGTIHRVTGLVMFGYFALYLGYVLARLGVARNRLSLLAGPDTILFRLQDLKDVVAMLRYFVGRGEHPRFGRYSYMEKFDYFAELWGVGAIGFTGLMLWFPEAFSRVFPGIAFNIAIIIHSYEAMIATAFIFTIHFFNVHLRPEKWPLDAVMFTGRASLAYLREEHPLVAERIEESVMSSPVSARAVADRPAPPPPAWMNTFAAVTGLLLLAVGVALIGLIMWGSLC